MIADLLLSPLGWPLVLAWLGAIAWCIKVIRDDVQRWRLERRERAFLRGREGDW